MGGVHAHMGGVHAHMGGVDRTFKTPPIYQLCIRRDSKECQLYQQLQNVIRRCPMDVQCTGAHFTDVGVYFAFGNG